VHILEKNTVTVNLEEVISLHFPTDDVFFSKEEQQNRLKQVEGLMTTENVMEQPMKIMFQDIEGMKCICTTICGLSEKEVVLKNKVRIPMQRILKIEYVYI
jgi:hypothetical protein